MPPTPTPAPARATAPAERVPAPDLARGAVLLLICLANVHVFLPAGGGGVSGYPGPASMSAADRAVALLQNCLVDGRAFPVFSLLVGYGTWQLARRRLRLGEEHERVRRLLRRRGWALVLIGALHGVLLFSGDIAATYGLLLVVLAGALASPRRRGLVVLAVAGTALTAASGLLAAVPVEGAADGPVSSLESASLPGALLARVLEWSTGTVAGPLVVAGPLALGALAARAGLLEDPARHRRTLVVLAAAGVPLAALGGLPLGLLAVGAWQPGTPGALAAGAVHALTGCAGGVGYAALAGLVVARAGRGASLPAPVRALTALGRRSLSGYLGHSVVLAALLPASTLGLGARLGVAQASALAVLTWLVLLLGALVLERTGGRGPAEVLLRRLTYGRPRPAVPVPHLRVVR
ncbi:DUF418 domain-containing protein [Kineococcus sp. SYSU DK005]|uniref:DUF418 domain-containing protein n=1 Tax=Kineococcus sp. SYSU DK005 TaxID=3383126 RepID=UPI003D7E8209